jgi:bis(5'-nucleosidyl)-tetraphosphatase
MIRMAKGTITLAAGAVVLRRTDSTWRVLMLRVYNYWDCPKGVVEMGEDPVAAARREVFEETGIDQLDFQWGERFIETPPYSKNKVARYYVACTTTERVNLGINPVLGKAEHHEAQWLSFEEAITRAVPRLQRVLAWARDQIRADSSL